MIQANYYVRDGRAPIPEKESISKIMSGIKSKNTIPEITLRKKLWHNGFRGYRTHLNKVPGRPDIVFTTRKIAVFVNGCFWHRCPLCNPPLPKTHTEFWTLKFNKNVERDKNKIKQLKRLGWRPITIWECQIKKNVTMCVKKIERIFNE